MLTLQCPFSPARPIIGSEREELLSRWESTDQKCLKQVFARLYKLLQAHGGGPPVSQQAILSNLKRLPCLCLSSVRTFTWCPTIFAIIITKERACILKLCVDCTHTHTWEHGIHPTQLSKLFGSSYRLPAHYLCQSQFVTAIVVMYQVHVIPGHFMNMRWWCLIACVC